MNKAFVREPEQATQVDCPRCSWAGVLVRPETLEAQLPEALRTSLLEPAFFCNSPRCEVVYFDSLGRTVSVELLGRAIYPKDPSAPMCSCFGLTADDIERDIEEGGVRRIREVIDKAKSSEAHCSRCAPSGQSCVAELQRYYMKRRGERSGG